MKKINLLILDDKEENIISLEALLADIENINIISTTDPNEALKLCWKNDISIALGTRIQRRQDYYSLNFISSASKKILCIIKKFGPEVLRSHQITLGAKLV